MALGHYDDEGVWMHGEDDTYATFSARLNKGQESISTQLAEIRADALYPIHSRVPTAAVNVTNVLSAFSFAAATGNDRGDAAMTYDDTTKRFTAAKAGLWRCHVDITVGAVATWMTLSARKGGTVPIRRNAHLPGSAGFSTATLDFDVELAVGEYMEILVQSGVNVITVVSDSSYPTTGIVWTYLGPTG